ncbi:hypothetical protein JCM24511_04734 [Saitozyma sp. JCM 24511]|nr:hypothetical protein JCM24511_04734 [Saitozyma sp. JCM 24511]
MPPNAARTIFGACCRFWATRTDPLTMFLTDSRKHPLLANVFSEAGPVASVEIKFDPQTGRSKGYAFVQFYGA